LIASRERDPHGSLSSLLAAASNELLGAPLAYSEEALAEILSPRHFVNVRRTLGGPAPEQTTRAAAASRGRLDDDRTWWTQATGALSSAEHRLVERSAAL
jgi:argininosuccinate lyase